VSASSLCGCCDTSANIGSSVSNPVELIQAKLCSKEILEEREQEQILGLTPELVAYLDAREHEGLAVAKFIATKMTERPSVSKSLDSYSFRSSPRRNLEIPWVHKESRELFSRVIAEYVPNSIENHQLVCENIDKVSACTSDILFKLMFEHIIRLVRRN